MELAKTYQNVAVTAAAGKFANIKAAATGKINRLHELWVTVSTTDGARLVSGATSSTGGSLTGRLYATDGRLYMPFVKVIEGRIASTSGGSLGLVSTGTAAISGYAVVSQSTA